VSDPDRRNGDRDGATSPASDTTVDLPSRFYKDGRKKPEPGDDVIADRLDEILKGKGMGRVFSNFVDGLFGPDGRSGGGKGSGSGGK